MIMFMVYGWRPKEQKMKSNRIQFDVPKKVYDSYVRLKKEVGAASLAEVIRNAIHIYAFMVKAFREGGKIRVLHKDGSITIPVIFGVNDKD